MRILKNVKTFSTRLALALFLIGCRTIPTESRSSGYKSDAPVSSILRNEAGLSDKTAGNDIPTLGSPTTSIPNVEIPTIGVPTLGGPVQRPTPVLVFLGGFTSCKDPLQGFRSIDRTRAAILMQKARAIILSRGYPTPAYLLACQFNNQNSYIYKLSSSARVIRQSGIAELAKSLSSLTASVQSPEVYFVGHSYGGWAAMKLALTLSPQVKVGAIVGVDAISSKNCLPAQFLDSLLKRPVAGCTEAPSDITSTERINLAQKTRTWMNLYQLDSRLLHSGAIANAENTMRRYPGRGLLAHGDIFDDAALASQVLALMPP